MRVQFEVSEELMNELQEEAGASSRTDLCNNAITILGWAVRKIKMGRVIAAVDETTDDCTELDMPIFETVRIKRELLLKELGVNNQD